VGRFAPLESRRRTDDAIAVDNSGDPSGFFSIHPMLASSIELMKK
jgi:hypothetical protein